jgi:hypothetical protein
VWRTGATTRVTVASLRKKDLRWGVEVYVSGDLVLGVAMAKRCVFGNGDVQEAVLCESARPHPRSELPSVARRISIAALLFGLFSKMV